jgi:hypothetical protein
MIIVIHALYESKGLLLVLINELRDSYYDHVRLPVNASSQQTLRLFANFLL